MFMKSKQQRYPVMSIVFTNTQKLLKMTIEKIEETNTVDAADPTFEMELEIAFCSSETITNGWRLFVTQF